MKPKKLTTLEDYKELLLINKHGLDDALEQQALYTFEVGEIYAEKVSVRDALKENIDTVDADIAEGLRKAAEASGVKITEAGIQQKISRSARHLEAYNDFLEAKKDAEKWGALRDAFIQRGLALRELANLYTANYFANEPIKSKVFEASTQQIRDQVSQVRAGKVKSSSKKAV